MNIIVTFFLFACLGKGAFSLECYDCQDCGSTFSTLTASKVECSNILSTEACYKEIEDDGDVNRGCTDTLQCTAKELVPGKCVNEDVKPCYICCKDEDNCNSASALSISLVTAVASLALLLLHHLA